MYVVTKVIKVAGFALSNNNLEAFLLEFYTKLKSGGYITNSITPDQFLEYIQTVKISFLESGKLINTSSQIFDFDKLVWIANFNSAESYQEYKNTLINIFNTDFGTEVNDQYISLIITEETT
jgi:hypothetical protein